MISAFIRAIWGDMWCNVPCYENLLKEVKDNHTGAWHPPGTVTYCYGWENEAYLRSVGISPILLSQSSVMNFTGQPERSPSPDGWVHYGISMFYHTLYTIHEALNSFDEVVFLDWDTVLMGELPKDFWDKIREGQPFKAGLVRTKRPSCPWRTTGANERPHAGLIYCRDKSIMARMMELYPSMPLTIQETIFALWADEVMGGWSADRWKSEGYEPYCFSFRLQAHPPEQYVFTHKRKPS